MCKKLAAKRRTEEAVHTARKQKAEARIRTHIAERLSELQQRTYGKEELVPGLKAKIDHLPLNLQSAALDNVSEALELNRGRTTHSKEVKFAADPSSMWRCDTCSRMLKLTKNVKGVEVRKTETEIDKAISQHQVSAQCKKKQTTANIITTGPVSFASSSSSSSSFSSSSYSFSSFSSFSSSSFSFSSSLSSPSSNTSLDLQRLAAVCYSQLTADMRVGTRIILEETDVTLTADITHIDSENVEFKYIDVNCTDSDEDATQLIGQSDSMEFCSALDILMRLFIYMIRHL